jgi:aminoglycoside phosphotransferase (APT) family kinase protein
MTQVDPLPSDATVRAILDVVAPESVDFRALPLAGSYSNHTHLVEIQSPAAKRIVVRRYNVENGNVVGKARCEFHALKLLQNHDVPAPRPLLLDDEGRLFGSPGIVTEYVPGRQISAVEDPVGWAGKTETTARTLAKIHAIPYDGTPFLSNGNVEAAWFLKSGAVPDYMIAYPEGVSVWHAVRDALPHIRKVKPRLVHTDYWSGNILWDAGEISAVVDWEEASYGDPALDVAYCRMEYYLEGMDDEAEQFLRVYEETAGEKVANLGIWELAASARPMRSLDTWLTRPHMDERFARFIANSRQRLLNSG